MLNPAPPTCRRAGAIFAAALILLLAFGLRAHRLAYDSVWWDEGFSVWMGRMPITQMLYQTANDAHPPLSYAMLHGWIALVGDEEFALRMQSVLVGVLTVAAAYRIGSLAGGRGAGLGSALLVAVMRLPVWWSQEVRMYAPATLFAVLALWVALKLFTTRRARWPWALLLALSSGAGLLTLYLFAGVVIALNLAFVYAVFAAQQRGRLLAAWAGSQIGALALFVPWAIYALPYLPSWETPQAAVGPWYVVKLYLSTVFLGIATDIERYLPLLIGALIVLVIAAAAAWIGASRPRRTVWMTLAIGTLLPPILVYLLSIPRGQFNYPTPSPRYFVLLCTPVYVLIGWGLSALVNLIPRPPLPGNTTEGEGKRLALGGWTGGFLLIVLLAVAGWSLANYFAGLRLIDDYQSMAAALEALRQPGDAVILNNDTDWPIFNYHYSYDYSRHITQTRRVWDEKYARDLLRSYRRSQGVWLVQTRYAEVTDPDNYLGEWLAERSWNQARYVFPEGQLWFFAMKPERGKPSRIGRVEDWPSSFRRVPDSPIADGVTLVGFTQPIPETRAGDVLVVGLGWHTDRGTRGEWPVAVKLLASDGAEIASRAVTLVSPASGDRYLPVEVFIPPGTPATRAEIVFVAGQTWTTLGTVRVQARPPDPLEQAAIPASAVRLDVRFGDAIVLRAADLPDQTAWQAGESIPLTLYWGAEGIIPERYKVFVHVQGEAYDPSDDLHIWGQQDQEPRGGASATTSWQPGEVIADAYQVPIQEDAPVGHYTLRVGLYLPLGGQRLPATSADGAPLGDNVTLFEIDVIP